MADRFDEILSELRSDRAEMRREFASWRAHIDRMQDQTDENLRFLRELDRRGEIALQELVRSQSEMREDIRAETQEIRANTETPRPIREWSARWPIGSRAAADCRLPPDAPASTRRPTATTIAPCRAA